MARVLQLEALPRPVLLNGILAFGDTMSVSALSICNRGSKMLVLDEKGRFIVGGLPRLRNTFRIRNYLPHVSPVALRRIEIVLHSLEDVQMLVELVSDCSKLADADLSLVADDPHFAGESIHPNVESCNVWNPSALAVAAALPASLRHLSMQFQSSICDSGCQALAAALPRGLENLTLQFVGCDVGDRGVEALATALPSTLTRLHLGFLGCEVGTAGAQALASAWPMKLAYLFAQLQDCFISDAAAHILKESIEAHPTLRGNMSCSYSRRNGLIIGSNPQIQDRLDVDILG